MEHTELQRRLLFLLHIGLVEGRNLAHSKQHAQMLKLCDVLEPIPGLIDRIGEFDLGVFRQELASYKAMYPDSQV